MNKAEFINEYETNFKGTDFRKDLDQLLTAEREECAKIVEEYQFKGEPEYQKAHKEWGYLSKILAKAIRNKK